MAAESWCGGAPRAKLERLAGHLFQHFDIQLAPIKTDTK
jgi:hypothetical protein